MTASLPAVGLQARVGKSFVTPLFCQQLLGGCVGVPLVPQDGQCLGQGWSEQTAWRRWQWGWGLRLVSRWGAALGGLLFPPFLRSSLPLHPFSLSPFPFLAPPLRSLSDPPFAEGRHLVGILCWQEGCPLSHLYPVPLHPQPHLFPISFVCILTPQAPQAWRVGRGFLRPAWLS